MRGEKVQDSKERVGGREAAGRLRPEVLILWVGRWKRARVRKREYGRI